MKRKIVGWLTREGRVIPEHDASWIDPTSTPLVAATFEEVFVKQLVIDAATLDAVELTTTMMCRNDGIEEWSGGKVLFNACSYKLDLYGHLLTHGNWIIKLGADSILCLDGGMVEWLKSYPGVCFK